MKNARRKTDVSDAAWLRQLHFYGLLRGSFRPDAEIAKREGSAEDLVAAVHQAIRGELVCLPAVAAQFSLGITGLH